MLRVTVPASPLQLLHRSHLLLHPLTAPRARLQVTGRNGAPSPCCGHGECAVTRNILDKYRESKSSGRVLDAETQAQVDNLKQLLAHYEKAKQQETFESDYVCHTASRWLQHIQMNRTAPAPRAPATIEAWQTEHVLLPSGAAAAVRIRATAAAHGMGRAGATGNGTAVTDEACAMALAAARVHVKAMLVRLVGVAKHRKICVKQSSCELPPSSYKEHFEEWCAAHSALREKRLLALERIVAERHSVAQKAKKRRKKALEEEGLDDVDGYGGSSSQVSEEAADELEKELPRSQQKEQHQAFAVPHMFVQRSNQLPPKVTLQDVLALMEQFTNVILPRTQFSAKQYESDTVDDGPRRRLHIAARRAHARSRLLSSVAAAVAAAGT